MGRLVLNVKRVRLVKGRYFWNPTAAVRKLGFSPEALGADPIAAAARAQELNAQVDGTRRGEFDPRKDTISHLISTYQRDPAFTVLKEKTRAEYERMMRHIDKRHGKLRTKSITRGWAREQYRKLVDAKGLWVANAYMRVYRILFTFACDEEMISANPFARPKLKKTGKRTQRWLPDQIETFCAKAVEMGRQSLRLGLRLAYDSGQRPSDIVPVRWPSYRAGKLSLRQSKTGKDVVVGLFPDTIAELEAMEKTSTHILVNEQTAQPYTKRQFQDAFRAVREAAGLPKELQFRDLRRTAAKEAREAEATEAEMMDQFGWETPQMVTHYAGTDGTMAESGQAKRMARRSVATTPKKPSKPAP